jgi:ATP dependent DNA ligase domain
MGRVPRDALHQFPVRLMSRRGNDLTYVFPSVEQLRSLDIGAAVFDGEIVAFRDGVQSFESLQSAMRRRSSESVAFIVFDVLWLRGASFINSRTLSAVRSSKSSSSRYHEPTRRAATQRDRRGSPLAGDRARERREGRHPETYRGRTTSGPTRMVGRGRSPTS